MDLVTRVLRAIEERPVVPAEFERCACALLQSQYAGLSAVEGGHDFGRDADIYFPFGVDDTGKRGRLLVTTGDPAANLRTGLARMREEAVTVDLVVIACLRAVNATQRATLDRICAEDHLDPPHVYARDWFVRQLVREPEWRQRLLGVAGKLGALLERPLAALEQATAEPELVGRETEREQLDALTTLGADVVVTGVPGIGKTRLLQELNADVRFLELAEPGQVIDDLLQAVPVAVVVDDAHSRPDELRVLRRARQQERLSFSIVATTWPDRTEDVTAALPGAHVVPVDLLERTDMDALIQSVGVTGYRARAVVLRQAEGRPGWALPLCELFVEGRGLDVVTGVAHLLNVERFLRRATESQVALDALACVAALRHVPVNELSELATVLGVPLATLGGLLDRVARNGLVEFGSRGWRLQPALRAPLIARWFFADPPMRSWVTLLEAFPDRADDLAGSVVHAAEAGSTMARQVADRWAASLPSPSQWDRITVGIVSEYAALDVDAALFAVEHARALLDGPRELRHVMGIDLDPLGDAAVRLLADAARRHLLPEAVRGLLDRAVLDTRPRHQTPEHPLRVLGDLAKQIDPDFGTDIEIRERLLDSMLEWLGEDPHPKRWATASELMGAVFSVEVRGTWTDPGAPDTVTWSQGVDTPEHLHRLVSLWDRAEHVLTAHRDTDRRCPPQALVPLVDLAGDWLRLAGGFTSGHNSPNAAQIAAGEVGGRKILESLRADLQSVPGLALRAQHTIDDLSWHDRVPSDPPAPFDIDPDLQDLFASQRHRRPEDYDAELEDRTARVDGLARRLAALGPETGTRRFQELLLQARLVANHHEGGWTAERMRPHLMDPVRWYEAAARAGSPPLVRAALAQCLEAGDFELPQAALAAGLNDSDLRTSVISAALDQTEVTDGIALVIADLHIEDVWLLDRLFVRDTPDEVLHRLLTHTVPAIAASAALGFAVGQQYGPALPEPWRQKWRTAIRNMRAEELDQHTQWRAGELLGHLAEHDPDLFEQWLTARLDETRGRGFVAAPEPHDSEHHLARLPQSHRERLARRVGHQPSVGHNLLTFLIGADRDLAERLLDDGALSIDDLLDAVRGQRNEILERLAPLLLEHGIPPERIAAAAGFPTTFVGEESAMHQQMIAYFDDLAMRRPELIHVAAAGRDQQTRQRDAAAVQERADRVRGR
jgi:hypothetical protein